eukprot:CAMPEP_0119113248 /NCGR_PEP_ID=MMETSP1180-20130426/43299_1 /TAXON_ID=3052 ORGANISM="Chlamydomonas cf sp, Strain CCMP681" /NCGR_SAMPLE_ID=MMETSP1180 /ASSEMBLY_ACC=CAM_ASM_000741 /LENGTH=81 /DNA_ID=CAMNT_0007101195 /DNA_START=734 /DNA_END=979 /DNA_ORIENTATION=+
MKTPRKAVVKDQNGSSSQTEEFGRKDMADIAQAQELDLRMWQGCADSCDSGLQAWCTHNVATVAINCGWVPECSPFEVRSI